MKCENCGAKISPKDLLLRSIKNAYNIKCENCKVTLKATRISTLLFYAILIIPIFSILSIERNSITYAGLILWVLVAFFVIQPFVFQYKLEKDTNL